jgi:hypothetical protein
MHVCVQTNCMGLVLSKVLQTFRYCKKGTQCDLKKHHLDGIYIFERGLKTIKF